MSLCMVLSCSSLPVLSSYSHTLHHAVNDASTLSASRVFVRIMSVIHITLPEFNMEPENKRLE